jgi:hypothetical protein
MKEAARTGAVLQHGSVYAGRAEIAHLKESGADYVIRLRGRAFRIYDERGHKIGLMREFSGLIREIRRITRWRDIKNGKAPIRVFALLKA